VATGARRLANAERVPYTLPLSIVGDYASISTGMDWWGGMPDPFDPRFAMATERAVAIAARDHRDDPWLIGYFADNELAWAGPGRSEGPLCPGLRHLAHDHRRAGQARVSQAAARQVPQPGRPVESLGH
jgi:hypothetical protein